MKRVKKRWNFLKIKNKGFTLVELIVAIGVLGIIVTPILSGFITSAKVNRDARQMMTTTDVAETLVEGIRNKSYKQVESCLTNIGTSASGNSILTSIDESAFNSPSAIHLAGTSDFSNLKDTIISVSCNQMVVKGLHNGVLEQRTVTDLSSMFTTVAGADETDGDVAYNFISSAVGSDLNSLFNTNLDPDDKMITYWKDDSGLFAVVGYKNIESNGQHFDAVMTFIPAAKTASDKYYNYYVKVNVYKISRQTLEHDLTAVPVMSMTTGIKNK